MGGKEMVELLFRGMLASYLLFYAFEIHQHPSRFTALVQDNVNTYAALLAQDWQWVAVGNVLQYYSQFLVVMSLAVVCRLRFGKTFGWLTVLLNLMLTWNRI